MQNCRGNPFCLSGLGEAQWLSETVNEQLEESSEDPGQLCRKPGAHVGLKNLGATCYVNSLLQLCFHNPKFRYAICHWNPLEDSIEQANPTVMDFDTYNPCSEIGHLQVLFALMSYSERSELDPKDFVESLGLDTSTQQDAQEFSKLFFSLLEERLKEQSLPYIRNMIADNFHGEYSYLTRCSTCKTESVNPSGFYELVLNISGHKTLDECLSDFLAEEKLEDANKYSCAICGDKQEAVRFIRLQTLPPTLNLQLIRFVYDRQKGYKKKLNSSLQFPEVLDMGEYLKDSDTGDEKLLYGLTAVLAHKGSSANSGHYIAYIKDSCGVWYTFNDQFVEKSKGKTLKLHLEEKDDKSKPNSQRLPKGFLSSTQAYMLVYTRNDAEQNIPPEQSIDVNDLCERLQVYIKRHNDKFKFIIDEETCLRTCYIESHNELKEKMSSLINFLPVENELQWSSIEVVSTDWIKHWLKNAEDKVDCIDHFKFVCPHDRLNPDHVNSVKYIRKEAGEILFERYNGGPRLIGDQIPCKECVISMCRLYHSKSRIMEDNKEITNLLKNKLHESEPGFWVDKESLKRWRDLARLEIECEINESNRIPFSVSSYDQSIQEDFVSKDVELKSSDIFSNKTVVVSENPCNDTLETNVKNKCDILKSEFSICSKIKEAKVNCSVASASKGQSLCNSWSDHYSGECKLDFNKLSDDKLKKILINNCCDPSELTPSSNACSNHCLCEPVTINEYSRFALTSGAVKLARKCFESAMKERLKENFDEILRINDIEQDNLNTYLSLFFENSTNDSTNKYGCESKHCSVKKQFVESLQIALKEYCELKRLKIPLFNRELKLEHDIRTSNSDSSRVMNNLHNEHFIKSDDNGSQDSVVCKSAVSVQINNESDALAERREEDLVASNDSNSEASDFTKQKNEKDGDEVFNKGLMCCHGNLTIEQSSRRLVPVSVWKILQKYFPSSITFPHDAEPCQQCQNLASEDEEVKDQFRKKAIYEKEQLKDLFLGKNRPELEKCVNVNTFFMLPKEEFVIPWRQYLRKPDKEEPVRSLNTSVFICQHGLLRYCPKRDSDKIVLLSGPEWGILTSIYSAEYTVSLTAMDDDIVMTDPVQCQQCMQDRFDAEDKAMLNYEKANIFVRKVQSIDYILPSASSPTPSSTNPVKQGEEDDKTYEPKSKKSKVNSPKIIRRSARRRKCPGEKVIAVSSTLTLKAFKVVIMNEFEVMPSDQHLFYEDGRELCDCEKTISELGIFPESTIFLIADEPTGMEMDSPTEACTRNREPETGFKGTKLIS
ncbi:ubiquitin carboxyl-terminal hydrolase 48-like isoform X2 [Lycorma delicatula]|uniref:ubiquitin carboxyl-terminal hydrolase 48-like isoform X2 n=1 Tax=Lycorma delicatula TaxID=130591 RepID=UPI003F517D45